MIAPEAGLSVSRQCALLGIALSRWAEEAGWLSPELGTLLAQAGFLGLLVLLNLWTWGEAWAAALHAGQPTPEG